MIDKKGKDLPPGFYQREDVIQIAKELLGKVLITDFEETTTSGIITEVEAYMAPHDMASHAYNYRRTPRTEIMYLPGGHAYVYLCYGLHHLFNVVTGFEDMAHAVLIRAIEPLDNPEVMLIRRNKSKLESSLTSGPGSLAQALGINREHSGINMLLPESKIRIEDRGLYFQPDEIVSTTRIGVDYAKEWALKPWRFYIKDSKWVSKK